MVECIKGQHGFHNLKLTREAAAIDVAAGKFPTQLLAVIEEHGYLLQSTLDIFFQKKSENCLPTNPEQEDDEPDLPDPVNSSSD